MLDLPSEEVPEHTAETQQPGKGKWLEGVETTIWENAEPAVPRKRQTSPYTSSGRSPAPSLQLPPEERSTSRREPESRSAGSRSRAAAARPATSSRSAAAQPESRAVMRVAPAQQRRSDDLDGRPTHPQPLLLDAPLLIRTRNAERISPDPRLWVMTQPGSGMAEQFRVLSLRLKDQRGLRVVAVAAPTFSAQGGLAATNLALALGEGTRNRVLLVDANLRRPQIGELFGLSDGPGLSEQVRHHRRQPGDPWDVAGLSATVSLLTAGAVEKNPAAVLSSESIGDLMQEARRAFDYVVVSSPPVLESADANILQDHLDGAILVVRVGVTRRDSVSAAVDRLGARHFLGTVMIDV